MFDLEVLKSEDEDDLGPRIYFKNRIYFGNDQGDFLINSIPNHTLELEIIENNDNNYVNGKILKNVEGISVNGKKTSIDFTLKIGDKLILNKTEILLKNVSKGPEDQKEILLQDGLQKITEEKHPIMEILNIIDKKLESN